MFEPGDLVYTIINDEIWPVYFLAEVGDYVFCQDALYDKDDFSENLRQMYQYSSDRNMYTGDVLMVKKEDVFATKEELKEVMKCENRQEGCL